MQCNSSSDCDLGEICKLNTCILDEAGTLFDLSTAAWIGIGVSLAVVVLGSFNGMVSTNS